jgi:broad-specificity NMP kinase
MNKQFDRFIARDESFEVMFEGFESQFGRRASRAPLHAVAGSPGVGKTRYLTQLQKKEELYARALRCNLMTKEHAALFEPDNVLVINITFNSFMPLQSGIESATAIDGLVVTRVLFQYVDVAVLICLR